MSATGSAAGSLQAAADATRRAGPAPERSGPGARARAETVGLDVTGLDVEREGETVLREASLRVPRGQTCAVIGASGCGKSTLLKAIAGLIPSRSTRLRLHGEEVSDLPARRRRTVYLYQEALLFPHLSVAENIAFGLRMRGRLDTAARAKVREMLDALALSAFGDRRPDTLSGGQQQRVAFGRALIIEPALLLLDEPFSSLDPETRGAMQRLFQRVAHERGITTLLVTHDVKEALVMGDCFATLADGRLRFCATREDFVADPHSGVARERAFWAQVAAAASVERDGHA